MKNTRMAELYIIENKTDTNKLIMQVDAPLIDSLLTAHFHFDTSFGNCHYEINTEQIMSLFNLLSQMKNRLRPTCSFHYRCSLETSHNAIAYVINNHLPKMQRGDKLAYQTRHVRKESF